MRRSSRAALVKTKLGTMTIRSACEAENLFVQGAFQAASKILLVNYAVYLVLPRLVEKANKSGARNVIHDVQLEFSVIFAGVGCIFIAKKYWRMNLMIKNFTVVVLLSNFLVI